MADIDPFASATTLRAALAARRVSAAELADRYIRRIEQYDGRLNAVVVRDFERARQQARAADLAIARGEAGTLLGVPITLKESINVAGLATTCGVPEWKGYVSAHDAPAAARLRAAGTVLLGKTNVPPVLADWLTALEVGSDIGGSIRVPATFCGVYGHRPSETLLPRSGQFPMPPMANAAVVMGVQGPLARSAEDLEMALSVLAGPEVGEDVAWRVELPSARHARLADFRVAVLPAIPWLPVDDEIAGALDDLTSRLGRLGCTVAQAQPEGLGDHRDHHCLYRSLLSAVTGARVDEEGRRQRIAMWRKADDEFSRAHLRGLEAAPGDYILWHGRRESYRAAWRAFFREWDVLLAPAINVLAYPHIDRAWPTDDSDLTLTFTINGRSVPYLHGLVYPAVSTVAGQPATAFPVGRSRAGLPVGLQAIGPYLEDRTPIRFAALLAQEIGGFLKPDGY
jgi:amidase